MIYGIDEISAGMRHCIPIVPEYGLYAEVSIDTELIGGMVANIALVTGTDTFSIGENLEPLGMWTVGEGRLVIASMVADWTEARISDRVCHATSHGFAEESEHRRLKNSEPTGSHFDRADKWCFAFHGKCVVCWYEMTTKGTTGPEAWDASTFGMDQVGNTRESARAAQTRAALRNRVNNGR